MLSARDFRDGFELRDLGGGLSHGLDVLKARHYDPHNCMVEKRLTLEAWNQHLQALIGGRAGDTIRMRRHG